MYNCIETEIPGSNGKKGAKLELMKRAEAPSGESADL